jgi:PmbA protein
MFIYSDTQLAEVAQEALDQAKLVGGTSAAVDVSESSGLSINVRRKKTETIEQNRDKGLGITVYIGQRKGNASTTDFSSVAIKQTVLAAYDIARHTGEDTCAGLPERELLEMKPKDLDLFRAWEITPEAAIRLAIEAETAAFDVSPLIKNSDGASVSVHHGHFVSANSLGFSGGYQYSRHSLAVAPIAKLGRQMQRDDWYSSARSYEELSSPKAIGEYAAKRALSRLNARKVATGNFPVLFEAPLACGLLGSFVQAVSGGALYRGTTFLVDSLGKQIFPKHIDIEEDPTILGAFGSSPFDDEGVKTKKRKVVTKGSVNGYFLSCYSARKLNMQTTGNAGGSHNLKLTSRTTDQKDNLAAMIKKMGTGLLVTDLMGQGVNYVTGDYSRGASGFWVEGGKIKYPVEEITIAGNLKDMFAKMVSIGSDEITRGSKTTGSILIESMAIAGN